MDNRYYFDKNNFINNVIILDEKESHHLVNVRRGKAGDQIVCVNGDGKEYHGKISNISKRNVTVQIENVCESQNNTNKTYNLYLAISKIDALEESINKATQLNISNIILFKSEFLPIKFDIMKIEKFKNIIKQSAKQCERATFPEITVINFDEMITDLKNYDDIILAYENADKEYIPKNKSSNIAIIVGNEGGFSQHELEKIKKVKANIISLGKTILRAPTAVASVVSIVMYTNGEFKK